MDYILIIIILFICSYIQTIAGFAFSLISVPSLLLCGLSLPDAVILTMFCSGCQKMLLIWHCRNHVAWKTLFSIVPWAILGLAIGVFILKKVSSASPDTIKQVFGGIILFTVALRFIVKIKPRKKVPLFTGFIASFISGIMNGFANIGGPPLVLWILAHDWPKDRLRSFIPTFVVMLMPIQLLFMITAFGSHILTGFLSGVIYIPVILLAFWLGNLTSGKISVERVRTIIISLLLVTGIVYLSMPIAKKLYENKVEHSSVINVSASELKYEGKSK